MECHAGNVVCGVPVESEDSLCQFCLEGLKVARVILNAHVMASFMCLPVKNPTIYRRNLRREKNDRLVSVHTSIDYGRGLFW